MFSSELLRKWQRQRLIRGSSSKLVEALIYTHNYTFLPEFEFYLVTQSQSLKINSVSLEHNNEFLMNILVADY
jgi:hypothetical protein